MVVKVNTFCSLSVFLLSQKRVYGGSDGIAHNEALGDTYIESSDISFRPLTGLIARLACNYHVGKSKYILFTAGVSAVSMAGPMA